MWHPQQHRASIIDFQSGKRRLKKGADNPPTDGTPWRFISEEDDDVISVSVEDLDGFREGQNNVMSRSDAWKNVMAAMPRDFVQYFDAPIQCVLHDDCRDFTDTRVGSWPAGTKSIDKG